MASPAAEQKIIRSMKALNRVPAEVMAGYDVHACTDISGFGFLGHACEMIEATDVGMRISSSKVPIFPEALEYAGMGLIPAGAYRNEGFRRAMVEVRQGVGDDVRMALSDPQTSGGLLIALPPGHAEDLVSRLHARDISEAVIVGEISVHEPGRIIVLP
jgi:selenide,water dikinase